MSIKNDLIIKAIERNKTEVVKQSLNLLKKLSNSFDIGQIRDKKGNTVLHYAVRNSNDEIVRLFIKHKIDVNLKNQYGRTPLTFAIGNFVTGVGGEENLSAVERLNRRFSRGDNLMIIDLLLRSGAKFDRAEHNYLLGIIKNQKSNNEYVPLCEKIEETLSSILSKKQEKGYVRYENLDYIGHIHNIPEYGNSSQYGISGYDNIDDYTSEHIYEEIDELRDNKEELSSNIHMSHSSSASSINSDNTWSSWDNDESKCQTLSNPQSGNEERSRTPESGYRSGDDAGQQKSKIAALPSYQSNIGKPLISPKPANLQTKPQAPFAQKMLENKISNPSFNKAHGPASSFNQSSTNSLTERRKLFENNTPNPNQQHTTPPQNKEKLNRSYASTKNPVTTSSSKELSKRFENNTPNPSFNKAHGPASSFNQSSTNSLTERRKLFENNTPNPNQQHTTSPQNKKKLNRSYANTKNPVITSSSTAISQTPLIPSRSSLSPPPLPQGAAPPPPPPPPLPFSSFSQNSPTQPGGTNAELRNTKPEGASDGIGSRTLLTQIQEGNFQLRKVVDQNNPEAAKKPSNNGSGQQGNFMNELSKTLERRRAEITGEQKNNVQQPSNLKGVFSKKTFENKTSSSLNGRYNSGFKSDDPSSKVLSGSIKKAPNRSNFLLETLPSR